MINVNNLASTIIPKSDQMNFEDVQTNKIKSVIIGVRAGSKEQPVFIDLEGYEGRPYKPCKTQRQVIIAGWGLNGHEWVGRTIEIYGDPTVIYGGVQVGGIKVSGISHIETDFSIMVTKSRGKRVEHRVRRLSVSANVAAVATITTGQAATIIALAKEAGTELSVICKSAGVASIELIAADKYELIANKLDAKIKAAQQ